MIFDLWADMESAPTFGCNSRRGRIYFCPTESISALLYSLRANISFRADMESAPTFGCNSRRGRIYFCPTESISALLYSLRANISLRADMESAPTVCDYHPTALLIRFATMSSISWPRSSGILSSSGKKGRAGRVSLCPRPACPPS